MGSTGFLKTVKMGGFDKKDVLNYVDELNAKIYKLENELNEKNDLLAGKQDNSSSFEGAEQYEARLSESKVKISELMATVDTLKLQTSNLENELEEKNGEISKLREENALLEEKAASAESNAPSMTNASFDIGNVFIEAKHSADRIITEAKNAAKKIEEDTRILSDQVLEEANKKAEEIVVNASSRSSAIIEEAKSKADSELEKAKSEATIILEETNKTKQSIKSSFDTVTSDIEKLAACLNEIVSSGSLKLTEAKAIMENSRQNVVVPNSLNNLTSEKKNW